MKGETTGFVRECVYYYMKNAGLQTEANVFGKLHIRLIPLINKYVNMKRVLLFATAALMLAACINKEQHLKERAEELCQHIPNPELMEQSKDYMTSEFYNVLDTLFHHLPEHEAMDHEWLHYFVTANGGKIEDCTVKTVQQTDKTHAVAIISVQQKWEDGSFDKDNGTEEHQLYMELVNGQWMIADFDEHKKDCQRHIAINRKEQAVRDAMSEYLAKEIGEHYLKGDICIPSLLIVATDEKNSMKSRIWCDCWVMWYQIAGDTLKTVSGGNHPGCMTLQMRNGQPVVTAFEQTEDGAGNMASAKRIFGKHFDLFQNMHSNEGIREAARKEQLKEYVRRHQMNVNYYQDYGWNAVKL